MAQSCRFALYNTRTSRSFLKIDTTQILIQALVISCLDYCNSLLAGLPDSVAEPLQCIQNTAVSLVLHLISTQTLPFDPLHPLAFCCNLHPIQDDGAGLHGCQRNCTCLPPNTGQITLPSKSTSLFYISWPADTPMLRANKGCSAKSRSLFWHLNGGTKS